MFTQLRLSLCAFILLGFFQILKGQREIDVSWDFNSLSDRFCSGWANATSSLIDLEKHVENGELRLSIVGWNPKLDSPSLFLNITSRHYLVMRARYSGIAKEAQWLLRSGATISPAEQLLIRTSYWSSRVPMKAISDTGHSLATHEREALVDGNLYSSFIATMLPFEVIFDLGSYRWITRIKITPMAGIHSPRRCVLLRSITSGIGPFENATSFLLSNKAEEQIITGFHSYGRYFKLLVLDNYGLSNGIPASLPIADDTLPEGEDPGYYTQPNKTTHRPASKPTTKPTSQPTSQPTAQPVGDPTSQPSSHPSGQPSASPSLSSGSTTHAPIVLPSETGILEIALEGFDESVSVSSFSLNNDGAYHVYYLPLYQKLIGNLLRMRMELLYSKTYNREVFQAGHGQLFHEEMAFDYIRVARAPEIWKVRGCLDKYYESPNYMNPKYNVTNRLEMINNHLPIYSFTKSNLSFQFATTYDCPLEGKEESNL
jgi:hypothetical protein